MFRVNKMVPETTSQAGQKPTEESVLRQIGEAASSAIAALSSKYGGLTGTLATPMASKQWNEFATRTGFPYTAPAGSVTVYLSISSHGGASHAQVRDAIRNAIRMIGLDADLIVFGGDNDPSAIKIFHAIPGESDLHRRNRTYRDQLAESQMVELRGIHYAVKQEPLWTAVTNKPRFSVFSLATQERIPLSPVFDSPEAAAKWLTNGSFHCLVMGWDVPPRIGAKGEKPMSAVVGDWTYHLYVGSDDKYSFGATPAAAVPAEKSADILTELDVSPIGDAPKFDKFVDAANWFKNRKNVEHLATLRAVEDFSKRHDSVDPDVNIDAGPDDSAFAAAAGVIKTAQEMSIERLQNLLSVAVRSWLDGIGQPEVQAEVVTGATWSLGHPNAPVRPYNSCVVSLSANITMDNLRTIRSLVEIMARESNLVVSHMGMVPGTDGPSFFVVSNPIRIVDNEASKLSDVGSFMQQVNVIIQQTEARRDIDHIEMLSIPARRWLETNEGQTYGRTAGMVASPNDIVIRFPTLRQENLQVQQLLENIAAAANRLGMSTGRASGFAGITVDTGADFGDWGDASEVYQMLSYQKVTQGPWTWQLVWSGPGNRSSRANDPDRTHPYRAVKRYEGRDGSRTFEFSPRFESMYEAAKWVAQRRHFEDSSSDDAAALERMEEENEGSPISPEFEESSGVRPEGTETSLEDDSPPWVTLTHSHLAAAAQFASRNARGRGILRIMGLADGRTFQYEDVPESVYLDLLASNNPEEYFQNHIRRTYRGWEVGTDARRRGTQRPTAPVKPPTEQEKIDQAIERAIRSMPEGKVEEMLGEEDDSGSRFASSGWYREAQTRAGTGAAGQPSEMSEPLEPGHGFTHLRWVMEQQTPTRRPQVMGDKGELTLTAEDGSVRRFRDIYRAEATMVKDIIDALEPGENFELEQRAGLASREIDPPIPETQNRDQGATQRGIAATPSGENAASTLYYVVDSNRRADVVFAGKPPVREVRWRFRVPGSLSPEADLGNLVVTYNGEQKQTWLNVPRSYLPGMDGAASTTSFITHELNRNFLTANQMNQERLKNVAEFELQMKSELSPSIHFPSPDGTGRTVFVSPHQVSVGPPPSWIIGVEVGPTSIRREGDTSWNLSKTFASYDEASDYILKGYAMAEALAGWGTNRYRGTVRHAFRNGEMWADFSPYKPTGTIGVLCVGMRGNPRGFSTDAILKRTYKDVPREIYDLIAANPHDMERILLRTVNGKFPLMVATDSRTAASQHLPAPVFDDAEEVQFSAYGMEPMEPAEPERPKPDTGPRQMSTEEIEDIIGEDDRRFASSGSVEKTAQVAGNYIPELAAEFESNKSDYHEPYIKIAGEIQFVARSNMSQFGIFYAPTEEDAKALSPESVMIVGPFAKRSAAEEYLLDGSLHVYKMVVVGASRVMEKTIIPQSPDGYSAEAMFCEYGETGVGMLIVKLEEPQQLTFCYNRASRSSFQALSTMDNVVSLMRSPTAPSKLFKGEYPHETIGTEKVRQLAEQMLQPKTQPAPAPERQMSNEEIENLMEPDDTVFAGSDGWYREAQRRPRREAAPREARVNFAERSNYFQYASWVRDNEATQEHGQAEGTLTLVFTNGAFVVYRAIPYATYRAFTGAANDPDSFYARVIRATFGNNVVPPSYVPGAVRPLSIDLRFGQDVYRFETVPSSTNDTLRDFIWSRPDVGVVEGRVVGLTPWQARNMIAGIEPYIQMAQALPDGSGTRLWIGRGTGDLGDMGEFWFVPYDSSSAEWSGGKCIGPDNVQGILRMHIPAFPSPDGNVGSDDMSYGSVPFSAVRQLETNLFSSRSVFNTFVDQHLEPYYPLVSYHASNRASNHPPGTGAEPTPPEPPSPSIPEPPPPKVEMTEEQIESLTETPTLFASSAEWYRNAQRRQPSQSDFNDVADGVARDIANILMLSTTLRQRRDMSSYADIFSGNSDTIFSSDSGTSVTVHDAVLEAFFSGGILEEWAESASENSDTESREIEEDRYRSILTDAVDDLLGRWHVIGPRAAQTARIPGTTAGRRRGTPGTTPGSTTEPPIQAPSEPKPPSVEMTEDQMESLTETPDIFASSKKGTTKTAAKRKTSPSDTEDGVPTPIGPVSEKFDMVRWDKTLESAEYPSDDVGELTLWTKVDGSTITFVDVPRSLYRMMATGGEWMDQAYSQKIAPYYIVKGSKSVSRGGKIVMPQPYLQGLLDSSGSLGSFDVANSSGGYDSFKVVYRTRPSQDEWLAAKGGVEERYDIDRYRSTDNSTATVASFQSLLPARKWIASGMAMTYAMAPDAYPDAPTRDPHVSVSFIPYPGVLDANQSIGVMAVSTDEEGKLGATKVYYRDVPKTLAEAMKASADPAGLLRSMRNRYPVLRRESTEGVMERAIEPSMRRILESPREEDIESILGNEPEVMAAIWNAWGNWYKTAALMNKSTHPDYPAEHTDKGNLFIQCMYCGRWATDIPNPEYDPNSESHVKASKYLWKAVNELADDPEAMNLAIKMQDIKDQMDRESALFGHERTPEQKQQSEALNALSQEFGVSHGICPHCEDTIVADIFRRRGIKPPTPQAVREVGQPDKPAAPAVPSAPQTVAAPPA